MTVENKFVLARQRVAPIIQTAAAFSMLIAFAGPANATSHHPVGREVAESIAKHFVRANLKDPDSAKYSDIHGADLPPAPFTGNRSWSVICGHVNSKNGFGGYSGLDSFVVIVTSPTDAEVDFASNTKRASFKQIWDMCDW